MILQWLGRLLGLLIRRFGGMEVLLFSLLWCTTAFAGFGLSKVVTGLRPSLFMGVLFSGLLAGWLLFRRRLPGWGYGFLGTILGVLLLVLTVGRIGRSIVDLQLSVFPVLGHLVKTRELVFTPVLTSWQALAEAVTGLFFRFQNWLLAVNSSEPILDNLVTSLIWGACFWLTSIWAVWWLKRRHSVILALLPLVVILAYDAYNNYTDEVIIWLVLFAGCLLLLQAASNHGQSVLRWQNQHLDRVEIEPVLVISIATLTVGMMLAGAFIPSVSWEEIGDRIQEILDIEEETVPGTAGVAVSGIPRLTSPHTIGPGPQLSQEIVLEISVEGYTATVPGGGSGGTDMPPFSQYYWRSQVYDIYTGSGWYTLTSRISNQEAYASFLPPFEPVDLPSNYILTTQQVVRTLKYDKSVFSAGELLSVDQPSRVLRFNNGEIIAVSVEADAYTATSRLQAASVEQLRRAGDDYPASFQGYFDLPQDLPQRVRDLALQLTMTQADPYDKAAVLEAYLRQFPYTLDVPAPPPGRDAVDFFLFDLKRGYCDYFASAMVVMARAAGLPARMVMGYASGTYDPASGKFIVRADNAHAWAEVYFPGAGWVEFEPTSSLSKPTRPGQEPEAEQAYALPPPGQEASLKFYLEQTWLGQLAVWVLAIVLVVVLVLLLPWQTWRLTLLSTERAFNLIFQSLYQRGVSFGIPPDPSRTPREFTRALTERLERSSRYSRDGTALAVQSAKLGTLTGMYQRLLFSTLPLTRQEKRDAIRLWIHLRRGLRKVRC